MNQPSPDDTTPDLLAFYDRVKPVLAKWLAKPIWTARETAMLCAGYIPHDAPECEKSAGRDQTESIQNLSPIDPHGYVPPDCALCSNYLWLLTGKEAAPPRDMVQLLRPTNRKTILTSIEGGQQRAVEMQRAFNLRALRELQWFFIIGNAVGLQVPALVPFSLLNELSNRLRDHPASDLETVNAQPQPTVVSAPSNAESVESPVVAPLASEATPKATRRNVKKRQTPQMTPEQRGYHTTEEVAGLTNLLPSTLNKYARERHHVEGFTPYKRGNGGKVWQWRDDQQQAAYEGRTATEKPRHRLK
jgi:hypothetical protein